MNKQNHNGMNVYYLNKEGRELIGSTQENKWTIQAEHHLLRNDVYIHYGCPKGWKVEKRFSFKPVIGNNTEHYIVPDARFQKEGIWHFVEVDRTQNMHKNEEKIAYYAEFSPILYDETGKRPKLIFYTMTEYRQKKLKELCEAKKLVCEVFTKADLR